MHQALRELYEEAARQGLREELPHTSFSPHPGVAWRAEDADQALWELRREGLLSSVGTGLTATLAVDQGLLPGPRRELLRLRPEVSQLVYRAGVRWAALVETAAKNWVTEAMSSGATVAT